MASAVAEAPEKFPMNIRVKSSGNSGADKDIVIVSDRTTVQEVKSLVFSAFEQSAGLKTLRLIYSGKLLEPPGAPIVSQFNLKEAAVVHAVFSTRGPSSSDIEMGSGGIFGGLGDHQYMPVATAIHSLGNPGEGGGPHSPAAGLGRLVPERGITDEQVVAMRSYFAQDIAAVAARTPRLDGEGEAAHVARAEELWMAVQGPDSEFNLNLPPPVMGGGGGQELQTAQMEQMQGFLSRELLFNAFTRNAINNNGPPADDVAQMGSYKDLFCGVFLGFLFGGIAILCVWDRNMTYRQKLGIIIGVMLSFLFNFASPSPVAAAKR